MKNYDFKMSLQNIKYNFKYLFHLYLIIFIFLSTLNNANALKINEIQFDPSGSDADREWIEIYNNEASAITLTSYKLFESDGNRTINSETTPAIDAGEYLVLVQDYAKFKIDFPSYTGKLFRAAFSLVNGGEPLALKNTAGNIVDSYTYNPASTGSGNGFSEQRDSSGIWGKGAPSPGSVNTLIVGGDAGSGGISTTTSTTTSASTTLSTTTTLATSIIEGVSRIVYVTKSNWPTSEKVYVNAGENSIALTGSEVKFVGRVLDFEKKNLSGEYNWSFGDGFSKSGEKITFHTYKLPGEYTAVFEAASGERIEQDRIYIKVIDPEIIIKIGKEKSISYLELINNNNEEINLGGISIKELNEASATIKSFTFPKNFSILPKRSIKVVNEVTGISDNPKEISLYYITGNKLNSFINPNFKSTASSTGTNASSTNTTLNTITNLNQINNISTETKKIIKSYVRNYTQNLEAKLINQSLTNNQNINNLNIITATTVSTNTKKILINREAKTLWQKVKEMVGM